MNVVERFTAAFQGQSVDRVPVTAWLGLPLLRKMWPRERSMADLFNLWVEDPVGSIIKVQENLGMDPMLITLSEDVSGAYVWPARLFRWPEEALVTWRAEQSVVEKGPGYRIIEHSVATPGGQLHWSYRSEGYTWTQLEPPLKEERDLDILQYLPNPQLLNVDRLKHMVAKVGNRGFFNHVIPGVWHEACGWRGVQRLCMDLYDRPDWVRRLLALLKDRSLILLRRLAETGIHSVNYNESWLGIGLSPQVYREFIQPLDAALVQTGRQLGILMDYHNCGRGSTFLEEMVATGAHALEPLAPPGLSGDFVLADVKRRVGDRICLFGGFNERILATGSSDEVRQEVIRCLDAAAHGGRYAIRPAGQIMVTQPGNIEAMTETVRQYGRY